MNSALRLGLFPAVGEGGWLAGIEFESGFSAGTLGLISSLNHIKDLIGPFVGFMTKKKK